jgi:hypothetical protein
MRNLIFYIKSCSTLLFLHAKVLLCLFEVLENMDLMQAGKFKQVGKNYDDKIKYSLSLINICCQIF